MKRIAIIAGGNSSEYEISLRSARSVAKALEGRYEAYIITIRGREWYWEDARGRLFTIDKNNFTIDLDGQPLYFDAAFIAIHGTPGENGLLQGYLEMTGIPYTGCNPFVSALTFNKQACKLYLNEYGIPMSGGLLIRKGRKYDPEAVVRQIGLPCFVKPNESGSSYGVTKVKETEQFVKAMETAFAEGDEVMVESFMNGTEVACGVVTTREGKIILPLTEVVPANEFFDLEAKYTSGKAEEITPARMPEEITKRIRELSSEIYDILGCRGIVRVDFIVTDNGPQFLEINTIPGMSPESIIPQQAAVYGISEADLYSMVIEDLF